MVRRGVLAAVVVAAIWLAPRTAAATYKGCCLCAEQACRETTLYDCREDYLRHGSCSFVAGGTCGASGCSRSTPTRTATRSATRTRTATSTRRPSRTRTPRKTPTPSATAEGTATATLVASEGQADTPTATPPSSATATAADSATPTAADSATPTAADSATATATETETLAEPTATQTVAPQATASATSLPSMTATPADTATATASATPTATPMCQMTPRQGCRRPMSPRSWVLLLRDVSDRKDRFVWKWRGESHGLGEFGNPVVGTDYAFCLYAGPEERRVMQARAPAGEMCGARSCWRQRGDRRFRYFDNDRTPDGLGRIALRSRPSATRAHVVVAGKGENLAMPGLPLAQPLRAQLVKSDGPECWEAVFSAPALRNSSRQFRDKND